MRQIQCVIIVLVLAVLISLLGRAMTASFLVIEQRKAERMLQEEIEKAKMKTEQAKAAEK